MPAGGMTGAGPMEVTLKTSRTAKRPATFFKAVSWALRTKKQGLWSLKTPKSHEKQQGQFKLQSKREL